MKSEARKKKVCWAQMPEAAKQAEAMRICDHLMRCYPGHLWTVEVDQGVAVIHNLVLSGRWGFRMKITDMDVDLKNVMRAGGELLERYRQQRGRMNEEAILHAPRNFLNELIHDA